MSHDLSGEALPEVGEGYRWETSRAGLGGEGDWERTESGEDGGDDAMID
jgi:hypothetical protein